VLQKTGFLLVFLLFMPFVLKGQPYEVSCKERPLNKLLVELRDRYDLHFSFDDGLLSGYSITIDETFSSAETLVEALLAGLPLNYEITGEVFVIFPVEISPRRKEYLVKGQVLERSSGEPLPFSHVLIDDHPLVTDLKGAFSYTAFNDSLFNVKASHLGCFVLDTTLSAGRFHTLYLTPSVYDLPEIVVKDNRVERSVQIGEAAGHIQLNSYISRYLPGNGDNAVFNLLRLQPGIVAAGEQPNDLIIWGSYEGTSRVTFDGFTIWGLKNFNDNISAVNPFLAKDMEIFKGGYDASKEDVVGGLVSITGNTGHRSNTDVHLFVNNQTLNGMLEVPVSKQSSLVLATRHTYYNLFDGDDVPLSSVSTSENLRYRIDVEPDYTFRDVNAKYSWFGDDGSLFYVSMMGAADDFSYSVRQERQRNIIFQETSEDNKQGGASLFWGENLDNGDRSHLKIAWSAFQSDYSIGRYVENMRFNRISQGIDNHSRTIVGEMSADYQYLFTGNRTHQPGVGIAWIRNNIDLKEDSSGVEYLSMTGEGNRLAGFVQDRIILDSGFDLTAGLRINHSFFTSSTYFDPRLRAEWKHPAGIKLNAAWGHYHQFLIKSSLFDETGNFRYTWSLADEEDVPVLKSEHWVAGATWSNNDLMISLDGYYKTVNGYTRYVRLATGDESIYSGKGRSYGLDLFIKKDFKGHTFWTSYSLGRSEELFPYFPEQEYRRAPHDQRHELKLTGLVHFLKNFHFSTTFVFGSGFPLYANYISEKYTEPDYSRLDLALVYRFPFQNFKGEAGISLLNALDNYNVKYSSFERIPLDQLNTAYIDAEAVEFTPLVFLKIEF
jgi:hypothetical protein